MHHTKTLSAVFAFIQKPIDDMIATGLFHEPVWEDQMISTVQIRKVARDVAKELKRPFIQGGEYFSHGTHKRDADGKYEWTAYSTPQWSKAYITVPKRGYLCPIITPLELSAVSVYRSTGSNHIISRHGSTYWQFDIMSREIWTDYYQALQTRPEMRKALKLPPL
jgi:hypothetical protein